jgi:hypothetical protein
MFDALCHSSMTKKYWLSGSELNPYMKLHPVGTANRRISNKKFRMMKCGIAALSLFFKNNNDRIPYFDIRYSLFDIRYSLFQSFFFDLTGRFSGQRQRSYEAS